MIVIIHYGNWILYRGLEQELVQSRDHSDIVWQLLDFQLLLSTLRERERWIRWIREGYIGKRQLRNMEWYGIEGKQTRVV